MEDERTLETVTYPSGLPDDWSKEDEEVIKEEHPPDAADNAHESPPQGSKPFEASYIQIWRFSFSITWILAATRTVQ